MTRRLLSTRSQAPVGARGERELAIDDDDADTLLGALSSDTTRETFRRLCEGPMTTSGVAEATDTSVQNARYHVEKLCGAGLIEVVDTWYSSRGAEMPVYASAYGRIVVDCRRDAERE